MFLKEFIDKDTLSVKVEADRVIIKSYQKTNNPYVILAKVIEKSKFLLFIQLHEYFLFARCSPFYKRLHFLRF